MSNLFVCFNLKVKSVHMLGLKCCNFKSFCMFLVLFDLKTQSTFTVAGLTINVLLFSLIASG